MCVVSMIVDSTRKQWPTYPYWPPYNPDPWDLESLIPRPKVSPAEQKRRLEEFKKAIELIGKMDKEMGAKDCFDPKKDEFIQQLENRLKELEQEVKELKKV